LILNVCVLGKGWYLLTGIVYCDTICIILSVDNLNHLNS